MKKLSLLLAIVMLAGCVQLGAVAEGAETAAVPEGDWAKAPFSSYEEVNEAITIIPAEGDQIELGYLNGIIKILPWKHKKSGEPAGPPENWHSFVPVFLNPPASRCPTGREPT